MTTDKRVTYSVAEVAEMTGLSEVTVRKRVRLGLIPSTTVGDRRLIHASWVDSLNPTMCGKCGTSVSAENRTPLRIADDAWGFVCDDCLEAARAETHRIREARIHESVMTTLLDAPRGTDGDVPDVEHVTYTISDRTFRFFEDGTIALIEGDSIRRILHPGAQNLAIIAKSSDLGGAS